MHPTPHGCSRSPTRGKDAARFRADLKLALITRPELFETTDTRLRIRIHDTRTTFSTLALANGATETYVQDRTGHRSSQQINGYRQGARVAAELTSDRCAARCGARPGCVEWPRATSRAATESPAGNSQ
jgi:integrase